MNGGVNKIDGGDDRLPPGNYLELAATSIMTNRPCAGSVYLRGFFFPLFEDVRRGRRRSRR
jgi:hypothetical protein